MITFKSLGKYGQLGNQMFQIASTIGIAVVNGQDFVFPRWTYSDYFEHPLPQTDVSLKHFPMFSEPVKQQFHYIPLKPNGNLNLHGYFQCVDYFKQVEHLIRYYFEPCAVVRDKLMSKYGDVLGSSCSVHVRRESGGDSVLRDAFWVPTQYYVEAMKWIPEVDYFLVFSNDLSWCKDHFKGGKFIFVEGQKDIEDMFLMSFCKHNIIGNSTFSWWSAWLNWNPAKRVVGPNPWLGWGHGDLNMGSLVQGGWVKVGITDMVFTPVQKVANGLVGLKLPLLPRFVRFALRKDFNKRVALRRR